MTRSFQRSRVSAAVALILVLIGAAILGTQPRRDAHAVSIVSAAFANAVAAQGSQNPINISTSLDVTCVMATGGHSGV